jgi:hypothetical protein
VITEDQFIGYLTNTTVENLIPVSSLEKLRSGNCLFLGYQMSDWRLRVFLNRIWTGQQLEAKSWAIAQNPDRFEREFWRRLSVEAFSMPLADYVDELTQHLTSYANSGA